VYFQVAGGFLFRKRLRDIVASPNLRFGSLRSSSGSKTEMQMNPMFDSSRSDSSRSIPDLIVMSSAENTWGIPFDMLEIGEKIGAGGSGQVYRGTYQGSPVALKELYSVMVEDATGEFKKEATILAKLKHPSIVSTPPSPFHSTTTNASPT
jgi:hypothetical protein